MVKIGAGGAQGENTAEDARRIAEFDKLWVADSTGKYVLRSSIASGDPTVGGGVGSPGAPQESNIGKYALAAVALAVLAGGAYWWTTRGGKSSGGRKKNPVSTRKNNPVGKTRVELRIPVVNRELRAAAQYDFVKIEEVSYAPDPMDRQHGRVYELVGAPDDVTRFLITQMYMDPREAKERVREGSAWKKNPVKKTRNKASKVEFRLYKFSNRHGGMVQVGRGFQSLRDAWEYAGEDDECQVQKFVDGEPDLVYTSPHAAPHRLP